MTDSTYTVERSTIVESDAGRVLEQIVDFHRWRRWSPWEDIDPAMERTYSGPESGVGAVYAWSGNRKAGRGRMQITEVVEPSHVAIDLRFDKPFKSENTTSFALQPAGSGTRVTWTMVGPNSLMLKVMGLFTSMDKLVGRDFEKGLGKLKLVVERP